MKEPSVEYGIGWYMALTLGACFYIWLAALFGTTTYYFWVGVVTAACIAWTFFELRKARLIENVPTSTILAAAQGYVELRGIARTAAGPALRAPLSGESCVWYELEVYQAKKKGGWTKLRTEVTKDIIRLTDETGECLVNPLDGEVTGATKVEMYGPTDSPESARASGTLCTYWFVERHLPFEAQAIAIGEFSHLPRDFPPQMAGAATDMLAKPADERDLLLSGFGERDLIAYYRKGASFTFKYVFIMLFVALLIEQGRQAMTRIEPCKEAGKMSAKCLLGFEPPGSLISGWSFGPPEPANSRWTTEEPGDEEASRLLTEMSPGDGLRLEHVPALDYNAEGWFAVNVGDAFMRLPPGWVLLGEEKREGYVPSVTAGSPENDIVVELTLKRREALTVDNAYGENAFETTRSQYDSAIQRKQGKVTLGFAPLGVEGCFGYLEIMNMHGRDTDDSGNPTQRMNAFYCSRRMGTDILMLDLHAYFAQQDQDRLGPTILNIMRSLRFGDAANAI